MEQIVDKESLWRKIDVLPAEAKREVIDFIAFLQTRYQRADINQRSRALRLSEEPFIGIWNDRKDMNDSVAWVRDVREHEWVS